MESGPQDLQDTEGKLNDEHSACIIFWIPNIIFTSQEEDGFCLFSLMTDCTYTVTFQVSAVRAWVHGWG